MIKRILASTKYHFYGMKFRNKLLLTYILLIIIPLFFFSYLTFDRFSKILQEHIMFSTQKNFDQTFSYINVTLQKIMNISDVVISNQEVQLLFSASGQNKSNLDAEELTYNVFGFLNSLKDNDIQDVSIYLKGGSQYYYKVSNIYPMQDLSGRTWYDQLNLAQDKLLFCPPSYFEKKDFFYTVPKNTDILSLLRWIKNPNHLSENIGLLRIDFEGSVIGKIMQQAEVVKGSITYIQNSKAIPVSVSDQKLYREVHIPPTDEITGKATGEEMPLMVINKTKFYYRIRKFDSTDWYLTTIIPYDNIFSETRNLQNTIYLFIVIIALAAFGLAWLLTYSMTKRISYLTHKMRDIQKNRMDCMADTEYRDEIGQLTQDFNHMLKKITILMIDNYNAGVEAKNSELKALQAQINPHFLYNTLELINRLAQRSRIDDVEQVINSMTVFYKLGLGKGKDEVHIRNEIAHITAYFQLLNMRYQNMLKLVVEFEDALQDYYILKITFQPIVENAIIHGILKKPSREGIILIEGRMENGDIIIVISDDGVGMDVTTLALLMQTKPESQSSGYGIQNIIDRMKLFYGEPYGLSFRSEVGKGTAVEIRIPAKETTGGA